MSNAVEIIDTNTHGPFNLHLELNGHGAETDAAHGIVDIAAALAEHAWRASPLSAQLDKIAEQIEANAVAQGLPATSISDELTEMLCLSDALVRQTARLTFGLVNTLGGDTAANFEQWLAAAERWLEANHCGAAGHVRES